MRAELNPRQMAFLRAYLGEDSPTRFRAAKSARAVGYYPSHGRRLLTFPAVLPVLKQWDRDQAAKFRAYRESESQKAAIRTRRRWGRS